MAITASRRGASHTICEHCGAQVADGGETCAACGMSQQLPQVRFQAKVIPFRPKKSPAPKVRKRRRATATLWWIIAIVVACVVIPYLTPVGR